MKNKTMDDFLLILMAFFGVIVVLYSIYKIATLPDPDDLSDQTKLGETHEIRIGYEETGEDSRYVTIICDNYTVFIETYNEITLVNVYKDKKRIAYKVFNNSKSPEQQS